MNSYSLLLFTTVYFVIESYAYRTFDLNGITTVLAHENESIDIRCVAEMQMAYCGFRHPSGLRYSFSGEELLDGHCSIKMNVTHEDAGDWFCYIGQKHPGLEINQKIRVRIVDHVAALYTELNVIHNTEVTLSCVSTDDSVPISYCRFEPPGGRPFSIDSKVKKTNAIAGKYYFPNNKSLDRGECAVTIVKVKNEDAGSWTCGAGFPDAKEYADHIHVQVQGLYTMTASVTGLTFGAITIVVFLALLGYVAWKKRHILGSSRHSREEIEIETIQSAPTSQRRESPDISPRSSKIPSVVIESPSQPSTSSSP